MSQTVADVVLSRLRQWGVEQVFGYPGDGINGLVAAFGKADDAPEFVQSRHEEMSAFAAVGFAKFSGEVGVCMATSGPGAIHLLNGLYDAKLDHVPVVAIVGQTARSAMGGSYQQEVDLQRLFGDVAGEYLVEVNVAEQLPNALDRAMRTARTRRGPAVVVIPADLQEEPYSPPEHEFKQVPSSAPNDYAGAYSPPDEAVARAAAIINAGSKLAILIGQGARGAAEQVRHLADLTGAGVAKALLGKDVLSDELPYVTGSIGLLGTRPSYELMRDCDTLLIIGSNFPYSQFLPSYGQARAIQIDIDGTSIGMRYPTELNIVGDAAATLDRLIPLLRPELDRSWSETVAANVTEWWEVLEQQAMVSAEPVNPMRVTRELSQRLPRNAIVTADSGSSTTWYARCLKFGDEIRGSLSGTLATMGCAVPYAIGAKFAHPDRPVIALVGDGAMQMNGLAELLTIGRYRHRWDNQQLVVCVFHNNDLNMVTWELRGMGGAPKFEESQSIPDLDYAAVARDMGMRAIRVDEDEAVADAWEQALRAEEPVLLDVYCDPEVAPIPPNTTAAQLKDLGSAVLKGDPNAGHLLFQNAKTKVQEWVSTRRGD